MDIRTEPELHDYLDLLMTGVIGHDQDRLMIKNRLKKLYRRDFQKNKIRDIQESVIHELLFPNQ